MGAKRSSFQDVAREMLQRSKWVVNPDTGKRELIFDRPIAEIAKAVGRSREVVRRQIRKMLTRGNPEKGGPALELVYQSYGRTASVYRWQRTDFIMALYPEALKHNGSQKIRNRHNKAPTVQKRINLYDLRVPNPEASIRQLGRKELNFMTKAYRQCLERLNISNKAKNTTIKVIMAILWRAQVPIRCVIWVWKKLKNWIAVVRNKIGRLIWDLETWLREVRILLASLLKSWRVEEVEAERLDEECRRTEEELAKLQDNEGFRAQVLAGFIEEFCRLVGREPTEAEVSAALAAMMEGVGR